ncbi:MAG: DUF742 domain-containing protein [Candidatus Bathyarchaeota archaeon]|nr:MAG: DUF742 domain-containing protein [Candidatus Bathyarchaeota archaeon]
MRRRTSIEIVGEILALCKQPQTKTRIMLHVKLPWNAAEKHLSKLQSQGLLQVHHSCTRYSTTKKGAKFLKKSMRLLDLLSHGRTTANCR